MTSPTRGRTLHRTESLHQQLTAPEPDGDTALDVEAVRIWLNQHLTHPVEDELIMRLIAGGRSNPTYEITDGARHWILRRPPLGHVLPTAHDMTREYRALRGLRDSAVPVPRTVGICDDVSVIGAPFYVMDKIDGITLRTRADTAQLSPAQRASLAESIVTTLADLHSVEATDPAFADWRRPDGYLERQLSRWRRQWNASKTTERAEVDELFSRLSRSLPQTEFPGIVHGDYKIDNLMVASDDPTEILGVLDWEMATLGDTLTDLGILCSFWDQPGEFHNPITAGATALPGFPSREDLVHKYATVRGVDVPDIHWYLVFADFKIAVILEGIHARHLSGHSAGTDVDTAGAMVAPLLNRALEHASQSSVRGLRGRVR